LAFRTFTTNGAVPSINMRGEALSPEDKRQLLDQVYGTMQKIAEQANAMHDVASGQQLARMVAALAAGSSRQPRAAHAAAAARQQPQYLGQIVHAPRDMFRQRNPLDTRMGQ